MPVNPVRDLSEAAEDVLAAFAPRDAGHSVADPRVEFEDGGENFSTLICTMCTC